MKQGIERMMTVEDYDDQGNLIRIHHVLVHVSYSLHGRKTKP